MDIQTVICFMHQQVAAFQFAEACVKSKECRTFQKHAAAVLDNLHGFDSWDDVVAQFDKLRKEEHCVGVMFSLEDSVLNARKKTGLVEDVVQHANQLSDIHDLRLKLWNLELPDSATNVHKHYVKMCTE